MSLRNRTPSKKTIQLAETVGDVNLTTLKQPPPPKPSWTQERGEYDLPQVAQQVVNPYRSWDIGAVNNAKIQADGGDLQLASDLGEAMLADSVIAGCLKLRVNALQGISTRFVSGDDKVLEALSTDYWYMETPGEAAFRRTWGLLLNICPVYVRELIEVDGRILPRLEPWNPRWLSWQQTINGPIDWYIQTSQGRLRLADYPGRWFLFSPEGFAGGRPWVHGLWYSMATQWLMKSFALADMAAFGESHATAKWFLKQIENTMAPGPDAEKAKRDAIRFLSQIPKRSGMYIPYGFDIQQIETSSSTWQVYPDQIKSADTANTKAILGSDAGTTANATYASSYTGEGVRTDLAIADDGADSEWMHSGPLTLWHALNFKGTKRLQMADSRVLNMSQDSRGTWCLSEFRPNTYLDQTGWKPDARRAYKPYEVTAIQRRRDYILLLSDRVRSGDEVPWPTRDITPPEDLVKIAETQGKAAAALVQLTTAGAANKKVQEAIDKVNFTAFLAASFPMEETPESGMQLEDEKPLTLRTSKWDVFDPQYASDLKENYPDIWDAGGSTGAIHSGDSQYAILAPLQARGGVPKTPKEQDAVDTREAWAARHFANNRLAGVVALIKWLVVGEIGEKAMKDVIEAEKERSKKQMELESVRNVRAHLHEGLQVADEIVDQLQQANPETMGDAVGQIKLILSKAKDYTEARKMLQAAMPNLDREQSRNVLTAAMLIAQATGMQTVQDEVDAAKSK